MEDHFPDEHEPRHGDARRAARAPDADFLLRFKKALLDDPQYCTDESCCSFFSPSVSADHRRTHGHSTTTTTSSSLSSSLSAATTLEPITFSTSSAEAGSISEQSSSSISYPLLLFADFPSLPADNVLHELLQAFQDVYVPGTPFVASMGLPKSGAPPYLMLSMALLGAAVSNNPEHKEWESALWRANNALLTGVLEIDNSLSRRISWLQAIMKRLKHTDILRDEAYATHVADAEAQQQIVSSLLGFYLLHDTMRAIFTHTPPAIVIAEFSIPLSQDNGYFHSLYRRLLVHQQPLPATLSSAEYLLFLIALLSEIVTLSHIGASLGASNVVVAGGASSGYRFGARTADQGARGGPASGTRGASPWSQQESIDGSTQYGSPLLPLSAESEYHRMRASMRTALELWPVSVGISSKTAPLSSSTTPSRHLSSLVDKTFIPLANFAHLMLEGGPGLGLLANLVAYPPSTYPGMCTPDCRDQQNHGYMASLDCFRDGSAGGMRFGKMTLAYAWQILETVEAGAGISRSTTTLSGVEQQAGAAAEPAAITPAWYPLVIFYSAIVIWADMLLEDRGDQSHKGLGFGFGASLAKKKVLGAFKMEMEQMKPRWGCTQRILDIIHKLRQDML